MTFSAILPLTIHITKNQSGVSQSTRCGKIVKTEEYQHIKMKILNYERLFDFTTVSNVKPILSQHSVHYSDTFQILSM